MMREDKLKAKALRVDRKHARTVKYQTTVLKSVTFPNGYTRKVV